MQAEDLIRIKELLPTELGSAEIREEISAEILRRSIFSAKMESAKYLSTLRDVLQLYTSGQINAAKARELLTARLMSVGYLPHSETGIKDHAGKRRLQLILKTNKQMAASVADIKSQNQDTLAQFPAWHLTRYGRRDEPREDWPARWHFAGEAVGWDGAIQSKMIALKASPIWSALGDGAGGFSDTLGNPYPPFAFNSGLSWTDVSLEQCHAVGLTVPELPTKPTASLDPTDEDIRETAKRLGFAAEDFAS